MLKSPALEIEREIERAIDERLIIQADRSTYRSLAEQCTERLKHLRDYIAELEQALAAALFPPRLVLST